MEIKVMGIDLAKEVFQMHGVNESGAVVMRKKVRRAQVIPILSKLKPCLIGIEACGGSNYWARKFKELGHEVRLISPQFVKPYVKSNKNDANDAEAICEAVSRPNMRFVSPKTIEQQDIQSVHRVRSRVVRERTALMNEIRGLLLEYGIAVPRGVFSLSKKLSLLLEDTDSGLTSMCIDLMRGLLLELSELNTRMEKYDKVLESIHKAHPVSRRLESIPGIGPKTATAIISTVSDVNAFNNGRGFSAYLGLVPRQHSSGGKQQLYGISKRGDCYIRSLLVHGARSVITNAEGKTDVRSAWIMKLVERRGRNRAAVALANKNARTIWALLKHETSYETNYRVS